MDALKNAVAAAFDNVVASGEIEKAIETHIGKAVASAIADQFSTYGDFNKAIKAKIATLVDVNLNEIDLPSYRDLVGKVIKQRVGAAMTDQFTVQLEKDIGELLQPAPAEITLEQLLKEFVEHQQDQYDADERRGQDFTLIIERSERNDGYDDIYISKEAGARKYDCEIQIRIKNDGEVWAMKIGGGELKQKIFIGPLFNFEKRLFQMYTAKTKLVIPDGAMAYDFDTTFPGHDYD